ncbi:NfeD family protein [Nocardioides sp. GCM10027113]|uniref:NfeD family protein n=1 Tax=unclassified Nocardioides TaxID=2615069 RepID=UPI0036214537
MEWFQEHAWQAWLGLGIALGAAEMLGLDLILLMLAIGTLAGVVTALLGAPVAVQLLAVAGASAAMLALVRPNLVRRMHNGPELQLGHGKLVGRQGIVTESISAVTPGQVRLGGEIWSAQPFDETLTIDAGETVEVLEIRGATAYVHPLPKLEP